MSRMPLLSLLCVSAIGAVASGGAPLVSGETVWNVVADASAMHVCMEFPLSRVGQDCSARSPQKVGPCGVADRSANVNVFRPGETITMVFNETVNHPSHYRVSFNPNGDDFPDPTSVDDIRSGGPYMLLDGIQDEEAGRQQLQVTFPNIECDQCTLQLIQVMYDKGANGFGGRTVDGGNDDMYYSCADIVLRRP